MMGYNKVPVNIVNEKTVTFTPRAETYVQYKKRLRSLPSRPKPLTAEEFAAAWDDNMYQKAKKQSSMLLESPQYSTDDYMQYYIDCIRHEDYETAKGLTELLRDRGIDPTITHKFILP